MQIFKKKFTLFIMILFISSCGYTPIYINKSKNNMNFKIVSMTGDSIINGYLKNLINNNSSKKSEDENQTFLLNINSQYTKNSISKDSKGNSTVYLSTVSIKFEISRGNTRKEILLTDNLTFNNLNDEIEEINYENSIKQNFAESLFENFFIQLTDFE
jgi:hypothetical protein